MPTVEVMEARRLLSAGPAMPNGPQGNFGTSWQSTPLRAANVADFASISMGADSSAWVGLNGSSPQVMRYDAIKGVTSTVWAAPGPIISVAAGPVATTPMGVVTSRVAWVASSGSGSTTQINLLVQSGGKVTVTRVPGLPAKHTVSQLAAGAGSSPAGTLWALDSTGIPYVYHPNRQSWSPVATGGVAISQLAVGSATNVWAVGASGGSRTFEAYQFTGAGFQRDATLDPAGGVVTLSATADGTVWAVTDAGDEGTVIETRPANPGVWSVMPDKSPPGFGQFSMLAAASQYRSFVFAPQAFKFFVLNYGIADQPATGFPAMNASQTAGFNYINSKLGLAPGVTIRDQYDNSDYPLSYASSTINGLKRPPGVSRANWSGPQGIKTEILLEIGCVQGATKIFNNIASLNSDIAVQAALQLNTVKTNLQAQNGDRGSQIGLFLGAMFNAAISGIAAAIPGVGQIVAGALAAGIEDAVDGATGSDDPNNEIQVAFDDLSSKIANIIVEANLTNAGYEQKVFADWGRIYAVGKNVVDGLWVWPKGMSATLANKTVNAFQSYLYRALMPLKYEIVKYEEFEQPWFSQLDVPTYDQYYVPVGTFSNGVQYGNLYFIHALNSSDDPFTDPGPFPTQDALTAIYNVIGGATPHATLFSGANGWMSVEVENG